MKIKSKKLVILQIMIVFLLPIILIFFNIFSIEWRVFFLTMGGLIIYGIIIHEKWSYKDMGLRTDNINSKSILPYSIFTILGLIFLFIYSDIFEIKDANIKDNYLIRLIFFLPVSFLQEFAYRSFLIPKTKEFTKNKFWIILINTILFTILHIIYPNQIVTLPVAFIGGIFFASLYLKYPNLILIGISHSILNLAAVLLGFFILN